MWDTSANNLVELTLHRRRADDARTALWIRRGDAFRPVTWRAWTDDVLSAAAALADLGVRPGDRVAQVAENSYEWLVADLAILAVGAVHVPLHASLSGAQLSRQLDHCAPRALLLSGPKQRDKLATRIATHGTPAWSLIEPLDVVSYQPCSLPLAGRTVHSFDQWRAAAHIEVGEGLATRVAATAGEQTLATILYTSGTSGEPRGVMLSHGNLLADTRGILAAFPERTFDLRLCFLPLSHIYARTCDLYVWLVSGGEMALASAPDTALADCRAVRPTFLNGVPYFYGLIVRHLEQAGLAATPGSLRAALGGRIELCSCGGAPIDERLFDFFAAQGVPLLPGYGLTEASPVVTVSTASTARRGSVGLPLPGIEVQLADDGEVLTRGPHVMQGYFRDPDTTAVALRDGWLHTGDTGAWDDDGNLRITGRKKDLLCTATGKSIVPTFLEALLTQDPLIAQAMVVGEGRNYLGALIVPHSMALEAIARELQLDSLEPTDLLVHPLIHETYERQIQFRLRELSPAEQVRRFLLLGRPFALEYEELTPKLSLRRHVIESHFRDAISALYSPSAS